MTENILVIIAFFFSIVCGFFFIPMILNFCKEKNLYDIPDSRKVHSAAIPRLGGISFLPSMLIAFLCTTFIINHFRGTRQITFNMWSLYFFVSLILIYGVGIIDDLIGLGAKSKFVVQVVAASLLPSAGLYINNLYGFLGFHEIPYIIGAPLTVFIIVFVNNAINLIDGIDGLSACLSFVALSGFLVLFMRDEVPLYGILIAGLMGVLVPFLYFNLWGNAEKNRKIFMGDSGSLTLGFILGFLAVKYSMINPIVMTYHDDSLLLSFTFLIVPVFDVVRVSLVRIRHRRPIFDADKNHIHHKLLRCGMSQRQVLACIFMLSIFYIGMNLLLKTFMQTTWIVAIDIVVWVVFHLFINSAIQKNGQPVFLVQQK